ncbi:MAG: sensor histidine kinase [Xanthobacteraceae bacterium]|jgi:two-component system C4-dicarboxylate transport sensor histidine kinase DctB|nr:sensor histidine kinase [Xanthobacteraceae bacterium]
MAISSPAHSEDAAPVTGGRLWLAFGLIAVLIAAAALVAAADLGRSRAVGATRARADDAATLANAVLRGELEKQRALPVILTRDPDVRSALTGGDLPALDLKLEAIARETRTAVIYLLDAGGKAISASNWREPTSFVGNDYAFRDYFTEAVAKGGAEQFALGTISNRPGLYITSRISEGDRLLGVIVVKVEFDRVEADWRALGGQTYVADARGVVLLSTVADWRFRTEAALAPDVAANVRRSLQFGAAPLVLPLAVEGDIVRGTPPFAGLHVAARIAVPTTDWHLEVLLPVDRVIRSEQWDLRVLAALFLMPGAALAAFLLRRRQHASVRRRAEAQIKAELERRVEERTAALAASNAQLVDEMTERARAQERLSDTREELAKANRLATLGQVTAGVAHEINQPLAAIRTYAENARALLQRQDGSAAQGALGKVVALTERIGAITETLRGFARRGGGPLEPVALANAIAGALMILDAPLRHAGIVPAVDPVPPWLKVRARPVELEQVLVNLLRNAIEAIGSAPRVPGSPVLALGIRAGEDEITLTVADRGPGLDEAGLARLFTPFRSTKPRGLGLGLVISHDIVTGFGGTLTAAGSPGEGCVFTIRLKRAQ